MTALFNCDDVSVLASKRMGDRRCVRRCFVCSRADHSYPIFPWIHRQQFALARRLQITPNTGTCAFRPTSQPCVRARRSHTPAHGVRDTSSCTSNVRASPYSARARRRRRVCAACGVPPCAHNAMGDPRLASRGPLRWRRRLARGVQGMFPRRRRAVRCSSGAAGGVTPP
ncbi:hypothetical protein B0H11DRAFT_1956268 [Mycena galericulata]|nr:hypothetical protein B0H11DRAFT_1992284 [Mycena galericulata]KAJ7510833.1 hypothetical protein B0H11DRAFT_1956268 [Mycena galericulata]